METRTPYVASPIDDKKFAALAKALGHPARIAIMRLLIKREACVCGDIVDELPLAQSTISQHLKQLKKVGFIKGEIDGPRICYCVDPDVISLFQHLANGLK